MVLLYCPPPAPTHDNYYKFYEDASSPPLNLCRLSLLAFEVVTNLAMKISECNIVYTTTTLYIFWFPFSILLLPVLEI